MVINKIIIILRKKCNYKNNFYCKIIILIIIYLFLIIIYFLTIKLFKTRNNFSRTQILTYASHYLKMCLSGKLINNKKIFLNLIIINISKPITFFNNRCIGKEDGNCI